MSFGVILATHAQIGCALLEGAEMLAGKQERARALALTENKSVAQFEAEFNEAYDELAAVFAPYGGIDGWLSSVCEDLIELRLGTFGIQKKDIASIVQYAFTAGRMDNNPVDLSKKDVAGILEKVL